jgi:hypothetical protein
MAGMGLLPFQACFFVIATICLPRAGTVLLFLADKNYGRPEMDHQRGWDDVRDRAVNQVYGSNGGVLRLEQRPACTGQIFHPANTGHKTRRRWKL